MPPDLPDDVWINIITLRPKEHYPHLKRFLRNLALTSRRLHRIATPFVYRGLGFRVNFFGDEEEWCETAMVGIIYNLIRARFLLRSPHLLRHVQHLMLWNWNDRVACTAISAYYFSPDEDWGDLEAINLRGGGNMISVVYDLITRLILHMPGLRKLTMRQSAITPLLYTAICTLPLLTSIQLSTNHSHVIHEQSGPIDLAPPPTLHIRELRYSNIWADGYLSNILAGSIIGVHTLSITLSNLPLITPYILNRLLSLKTLQVEFHEDIVPDHDAQLALWETLRLTPDLRRLLIHEYRLDVLPPDDLCNHLCNLVQLSASPTTIRKLARGMELDTIEMRRPFNISEQSIAQRIPCSPTHLRVLTLHAVKPMTQRELDRFMGSFHVFPNLEYLDVNHQYPYSPGSDFYESWQVIKELWHKLKHLRCFNLRGYNPFDRANEEPYGFEVACPLDINDELPRGHPTLERIGVSFLGRSLWDWVPENGWVSRPWTYSAWHSGSYMSWNRVY